MDHPERAFQAVLALEHPKPWANTRWKCFWLTTATCSTAASCSSAQPSQARSPRWTVRAPGTSGFEFLALYQALCNADPHCAVVVRLSSSRDPHDPETAPGFACVRDLIVKPLTLEAA